MDFSLNSSVVLAAIVGLWLVWVAPYALRRHGSVSPAASTTVPLIDSAAAEDNGPQGSIMNMSTTSADSASPTTGGDQRESVETPSAKPLRIRYVRLAVAIAGLAGLVTFLAVVVPAAAGALPALLPTAALAAAVLSVSVLRTLAVRDRRRRLKAAFDDAMTGGQARTTAPQAGPPPETTLFNGEAQEDHVTTAGNNDAGTPTAPPLTAAELRSAALAVAAEAGDVPGAAGAPWQPVEVPKPTYIEAPKAERQAPAPLELPEVPKAQVRTAIKDAATPPPVEKTQAETAPNTARINLDDVLQRRRA
ncbi:hypothetical protein [Arthrobacter sp. H5]|uniref:hypothetical protein n=1 Tax=Arthrobacter sp. H5 TaxID=1267973 RepID=UPI00048681EB|nr:hypothetical protein [Arthrobacter sp. H5]